MPASAPAAPAATMSGSRCSSRGWLVRAPGAHGPLAECRIAGGRVRIGHRPGQPLVEGLGLGGDAGIFGEEAAQIVEAQAAADDQHALVAQRLQRPADGEMGRRIERGGERQLHHRNIGFGIDQQERHEDAMVEAARRVGGARMPACPRRRRTLGQPGRARRRIAQLIGMGGKP
jgi:hypothetical protein